MPSTAEAASSDGFFHFFGASEKSYCNCKKQVLFEDDKQESKGNDNYKATKGCSWWLHPFC